MLNSTSSDMHKSEATVITVVLQVASLSLTSSPAFVSCFSMGPQMLIYSWKCSFSALLLASDTMRPFYDPCISQIKACETGMYEHWVLSEFCAVR
jgi:hypothetical protein